MGKLDDSAQIIIRKSVNKYGKLETAKYYHIPQVVIDQYLLGVHEGSLTSRNIIRLEIERMKNK